MSSDGSEGPRSASGAGPGGGSAGPPSDDAAGKRPEDSAILHILLNLAFMVAFAYLFRAAGTLPDSQWEPLGSGTFPRIVLGCLILLNVIMIGMKLRPAGAEFRRHGHDFGRLVAASLNSSALVIATFVLFGVFLLAIAPLGFVLSAFLFILVVQLLLGPVTVKSVIVAVVIAVVTALGVDYVFQVYFNVFLPEGRLWRSS